MQSEPWFLAPTAAAELNDRIETAKKRSMPKSVRRKVSHDKDVAIVPVVGPLVRSSDFLSTLLGLSTYEQTINELRYAEKNERIGGIVLHIDSPGGTASGCQRVAEVVEEVNRTKPVVAVCDGYMCSAAYYIASASSFITASPDALVGSIGTVMELQNAAKLLERIGIETNLISTGEFKTAGHPSAPLTDEHREYFEGIISDLGQHFASHVIKHRRLSGESQKEVLSAKVFVGQKAVDIGLIDAVAYPEETIKSMVTREPDIGRFRGSFHSVVRAMTRYEEPQKQQYVPHSRQSYFS